MSTIREALAELHDAVLAELTKASGRLSRAMTVASAALAAEQQEPVAWMTQEDGERAIFLNYDDAYAAMRDGSPDKPISLFAVPPQPAEQEPRVPSLRPSQYEDTLPDDITDREYAAWFAMSWLDGGQIGCRVGPTIERIRAALESADRHAAPKGEVERDAARYRAIRNDQINVMALFGMGCDDDRMVDAASILSDVNLDRAIDAALAERKE